jgi:hypothetical protein
MREDELFAAYRFAGQKKAGPVRTLSHRCMYESCPTMIADWAQRKMCRFHERKARERFSLLPIANAGDQRE